MWSSSKSAISPQTAHRPSCLAISCAFSFFFKGMRFLCLFQRNAFSPEKGQGGSLSCASQSFSSIIDPESVKPRSDIFVVLGQGLDAYISGVSVAGATFVNQLFNLRQRRQSDNRAPRRFEEFFPYFLNLIIRAVISSRSERTIPGDCFVPGLGRVLPCQFPIGNFRGRTDWHLCNASRR